MMIVFDTPQGVNGEAARDEIVRQLDLIQEQVFLGRARGEIRDLNGNKVGVWVIGAALMPHLQERAA